MIQQYVIKFVSDLRQVGGFLLVLRFSPQKTDSHNIAETLLKVAISIIILSLLLKLKLISLVHVSQTSFLSSVMFNNDIFAI
jgi:hypothetical protein